MTDELLGTSMKHLQVAKEEALRGQDEMYEGRAGLRSAAMQVIPEQMASTLRDIQIMPQDWTKSHSPVATKAQPWQSHLHEPGTLDRAAEKRQAVVANYRPPAPEVAAALDCTRQQMYVPGSSFDRRKHPGLKRVQGDARTGHPALISHDRGSSKWEKQVIDPRFDGLAGRPTSWEAAGRFELYHSPVRGADLKNRGFDHVRIERAKPEQPQDRRQCQSNLDELAKSLGRRTFRSDPHYMATGTEKAFKGASFDIADKGNAHEVEREEMYDGGAGTRTWREDPTRGIRMVRNADGELVGSLESREEPSGRPAKRQFNEPYMQAHLHEVMRPSSPQHDSELKRPVATLEGFGVPSGLEHWKLLNRHPKPVSHDVDWVGRSTVPLGGPTPMSVGAPGAVASGHPLAHARSSSAQRCCWSHGRQRPGASPRRPSSAGPSYAGRAAEGASVSSSAGVTMTSSEVRRFTGAPGRRWGQGSSATWSSGVEGQSFGDIVAAPHAETAGPADAALREPSFGPGGRGPNEAQVSGASAAAHSQAQSQRSVWEHHRMPIRQMAGSAPGLAGTPKVGAKPHYAEPSLSSQSTAPSSSGTWRRAPVSPAPSNRSPRQAASPSAASRGAASPGPGARSPTPNSRGAAGGHSPRATGGHGQRHGVAPRLSHQEGRPFGTPPRTRPAADTRHGGASPRLGGRTSGGEQRGGIVPGLIHQDGRAFGTPPRTRPSTTPPRQRYPDEVRLSTNKALMHSAGRPCQH